MQQTKHRPSTRALAMIVAGVLIGGGAVTAAVVRLATMHGTVTINGSETYDFEMDQNGSTQVVTDSGDVIQIEGSVDDDTQKMTVLVEAGQSATITVGTEDDYNEVTIDTTRGAESETEIIEVVIEGDGQKSTTKEKDKE